MAQAAILVGMRLLRLILKRVGVHGIETQTEGLGTLSKFRGIVWFVPGNMQRHSSGRSGQLIDHCTVSHFFVNVSRFTDARKPCESRATSANAPGGNGNIECHYARRNRLNVNVVATQLFTKMLIVVVKGLRCRRIMLGDKVEIDWEVGHSLGFPIASIRKIRKISRFAIA